MQGKETGNYLTVSRVVALSQTTQLPFTSDFNDCVLSTIFRRGLSSSLKDELTVHDDSATLDELIGLAIRLDNRLRERRRELGPSKSAALFLKQRDPQRSLCSIAANMAYIY